VAARTVKIRHDEETRAKIQTSQLINRLHDHIFGKDGQAVEVSTTQMKAIEVLLRKTLPDLTSTELTGDADNPVAVEHIQRTIVDPRDTNGSGSTPAT